MEDAHVAGHGARYPCSARGGFCTMTRRAQLHLEWVFRSASEGATNVALKSSTRVHPLHLPWFLLARWVKHQGKRKLLLGGKILHSRRGKCSFGWWKWRPTRFLGLLTSCQKKQNPWATQHRSKCAPHAVLWRASLFLRHQNRLQWHLWSWADLTPCWIPFRWGVPTAHPALQMLLLSEKRELNKPGSPFLLGWTQRQSDMENCCSVPWTMYLVKEQCQHFVLIEEKAETHSAKIQAGSSQWL